VTSAPVADQLRLLDVQALDTKAAQIAHAKAHHPQRAVVAEAQARLAELEDRLVVARTAVSDARRELAKAETDVDQVRARAERDQARLDSGQASVKDVQALSEELEALARRRSTLEDVQLEVMERLEALEGDLAAVEAEAEQVRTTHAEASAELERALADLDAQAEAVAAERAAKVQGLDAGLVALYERLRAQLGGTGVAALRGRRCEGCRLDLNASELARITALPADEVVRCDECGRILVRGADAA
jgi:predicted  nucleic acid-binding Zn-ribbon protein